MYVKRFERSNARILPYIRTYLSTFTVFVTTATDVVTVYVFQEPSLLSSLQDKGLTDVVLQALLVKEVSL